MTEINTWQIILLLEGKQAMGGVAGGANKVGCINCYDTWAGTRIVVSYDTHGKEISNTISWNYRG